MCLKKDNKGHTRGPGYLFFLRILLYKYYYYYRSDPCPWNNYYDYDRPSYTKSLPRVSSFLTSLSCLKVFIRICIHYTIHNYNRAFLVPKNDSFGTWAPGDVRRCRGRRPARGEALGVCGAGEFLLLLSHRGKVLALRGAVARSSWP